MKLHDGIEEYFLIGVLAESIGLVLTVIVIITAYRVAVRTGKRKGRQ